MSLDDLLNIPYDEPDMNDVERVCDEVRHEPVHWLAAESYLTWHNPIGGIACGAGGVANTMLTKVTCPDCREVVIRRRCLALEDVPGPMAQRCTRPLHDDERHSWRWDSVAVEVPIEQDSPSGMLPRRTPGVALGDSEESDGVEGPGDAAGGARSILGRSVIERWRG